MRVFLKILIVFLAISFVGCQSNKDPKSKITVSIWPQKFIVEKLLGDTIHVNVMVPKGSSPATYSPSPVQIKNVSESKLYLCIGHIGFEQTWLNKIAKINPKLKIIDTSEGVKLIRGEDYVHGDHVHKGGIDPHIWTSPKTMLKVCINTERALINAFPKKKSQIVKNAKRLEEEIKKLDKEFKEFTKDLKNRSFFIFHPAYTYLARDYNLEQISIEDKGKEPGAKWIKELVDDAKEKNIKAIFIQEEFDKRNAEIIAKELNIKIVQVNPLSVDWESEMRNTLKKLVDALE